MLRSSRILCWDFKNLLIRQEPGEFALMGIEARMLTAGRVEELSKLLCDLKEQGQAASPAVIELMKDVSARYGVFDIRFEGRLTLAPQNRGKA